MKIAYIVLKGMPLGGGIEKYTEEVGSRLAARGHEVMVYTMKHYGTREGYYKGMRIKKVPTINSKSLEKLLASFTATISQFAEKDIDIVHFHAFGPAMFCLIPKLFGRKVIVQGHGIEWKRSRWGFWGELFLRLMEIPSVKFPHQVTVVSKVQQRYLKERYGIDSIYIPTGVNSPNIEPPELIKRYGLEGRDYILFAGRLVREKGVHYLIEAYNRLNPPLKLVITGDAQHEEDYKSELKSLAGDNKNIIFTGFVTGKLLDELFSNCYIFVLPSEVEGLSTALLEAMSYGNCCLVSDIPENLEALNGLGRTFISKDVSSLTEHIDYLISNPQFVESIRPKAQRYVLENYSWDTIADKFEKLYRKLLS